MKVKIAICDDDLSFAGSLENMIYNLQTEFTDDFDVEVFASGEELMERLGCGAYFSIVFLDIEMGGSSGINVGKYIRNGSEDFDTVIIYVSSHEHYHLELYPIRPIAFIRKPPDYKSLRGALTLAFAELKRLKPQFAYQKGAQIIQVRKADIYYFESAGKKLRIVTATGENYFTMSLERLIELFLDEPNYIAVHRAFVANLANVTKFTRVELCFPNGDQIPISTKRSKDVKKALLNYHTENGIPSNMG